MTVTLKIIGFISGIILIGSLIVMNAEPANVNFIFVDGEVAVFLIIIVSFLIGFVTCLTYLWLKKALLCKKDFGQKAVKHDDIFGDV